MVRDAFLSYSKIDKSAADEVCRILEKAGVKCWIAPRNIPPGATWADSIVRAIAECRAMLLFCSANTSASKQMIRELQLADEASLPILPVRLADVRLEGGFSYYVNNRQWFDVFPGEI